MNRLGFRAASRIASSVGLIAASTIALWSPGTSAAVDVVRAAVAPSAAPSLDYGERLYRAALKFNPSLRRIHDGSIAMEALSGDAPTPDPAVGLVDDSVTVARWDAIDASVDQMIEADDGTIYAIIDHSRGFIGDDALSISVLENADFRRIRLPAGVRVIEFETYRGGAPYVSIYKPGERDQFAARLTPDKIVVGARTDVSRNRDDIGIPSSARRCPASLAAIRRNASDASHGVSRNLDVDIACILIGDLGFVTLSAGSRSLTYLVDGRGFHPFSTWQHTMVTRDAVLLQQQTPWKGAEIDGSRDSYVVIRTRKTHETASAPPGV